MSCVKESDWLIANQIEPVRAEVCPPPPRVKEPQLCQGIAPFAMTSLPESHDGHRGCISPCPRRLERFALIGRCRRDKAAQRLPKCPDRCRICRYNGPEAPPVGREDVHAPAARLQDAPDLVVH